ncbi:MAG: FAD binding domain-containing protein [Gammaproteobacteria bacterium]
MQLPRFEYLRPESLAEGLAMLAEHGADARILSGGSDLLINMKFRLDTPRVLVSLNGLAELQEVEETADGGLRIGAGCKLTDLVNHPLIVAHCPALRDALYGVASKHIRNVGTLGGNLCLDTRCWYTNQSEDWRATRDGCFKTDEQLCHVIKTASRCHAINSSDSAPLLIAVGASVTLASDAGLRDVALIDFYRDDGVDHTVLEPGEAMVFVTVPRFDGRAIFAKLAQREGLDFAAGTFAAAVTGPNDNPGSVRLVMNSIGAAPKVLAAAERILMKSGLTDEAIEEAALAARATMGKITNLFTPSGFKRRLVKALIRDALVDLRAQAI